MLIHDYIQGLEAIWNQMCGIGMNVEDSDLANTLIMCLNSKFNSIASSLTSQGSEPEVKQDWVWVARGSLHMHSLPKEDGLKVDQYVGIARKTNVTAERRTKEMQMLPWGLSASSWNCGSRLWGLYRMWKYWKDKDVYRIVGSRELPEGYVTQGGVLEVWVTCAHTAVLHGTAVLHIWTWTFHCE